MARSGRGRDARKKQAARRGGVGRRGISSSSTASRSARVTRSAQRKRQREARTKERGQLLSRTTGASGRGRSARGRGTGNRGAGKRGLLRVVNASLLFVITGLLGYSLFFSPFFRIEQVVVEGNQVVTQTEIDAVVTEAVGEGGVFNPTNYFLFPAGRVEEEVLARFANITSARVERQFPRLARLYVYERTPVLAWSSNGVLTALDASGTSIGEISQVEVEELGLRVVRDESGSEVRDDMKLAHVELVAFARDFPEILREVSDIEVVEVSTPSPSAGELSVLTADGFRVLLDPAHDPRDRAEVLRDVLAQEVGDSRGKIEYIDMRLENWAYYK